MALADSVKNFVWGAGGQRLTPEQVTVLRALQARKRMQGVDTSPVASWTQGAARLADAFGDVVQERRLDSQDQRNQAEDAALFAPLSQAFSSSLTGTPSAVPMPGAGAEVSASSPAYSPAPVTASGEIADYIRQSASARGIDPDIALRVAQSEGGLENPVNQSNYVKNGVREQSYGPFQLYLGGGLGNKALEAGIDPRDPNQWKQGVDFALDQAKTGGWGPWYGAKKLGITGMTGIGNAPVATNGIPPVIPVETASLAAPQTATDAIAAASPTQTPYVDPQVTTAYQAPPPPMTAPQNVQQQPVRGNRLGQAPAISQGQFDERFGAPQQFDAGSPDMVAASLMGNPTPQVSPQAIAAQVAPQPVQQAAPQPQYPQAPQVQTVPPQVLAQAIQASQSPYASERTKTVANAIIQQQQAAQAAQQKQNQFVFEQQYQQAAQANDPLRQAQILKAQQDVAAGADRTPESVRALQQRAELSGLQPGTPEYNNFIQTGGNVQRTEAAPPVGYRYVRDPSGAISNLELIPGSPQAMEAEKAALKQSTTNELKDVAANTVVSSIGKAINAIQAPGLPATGTFGNMLSGVPESNAAELRRQLASIKSNITLDSLQAARAASPTGAALGAVSDKEGELLANKLGALDPSSPNFQRDILDVQKTYLQTVYGKEKGGTLFDQSVTLRNANAAIAKGANREAVLKKLQDAGIPTEGLQ